MPQQSGFVNPFPGKTPIFAGVRRKNAEDSPFYSSTTVTPAGASITGFLPRSASIFTAPAGVGKESFK